MLLGYVNTLGGPKAKVRLSWVCNCKTLRAEPQLAVGLGPPSITTAQGSAHLEKPTCCQLEGRNEMCLAQAVQW